jgi:hypothetical protein
MFCQNVSCLAKRWKATCKPFLRPTERIRAGIARGTKNTFCVKLSDTCQMRWRLCTGCQAERSFKFRGQSCQKLFS